jgi:prevent-host-death family protein
MWLRKEGDMTLVEAGVRELKAKLSAYLRRVEAGETIVIVRRGKQIAYLIPQEQTLDERIDVAKKAGLLDWNGQKLRPASPVAANSGAQTVAEMIVEDRE